MWFKKRKKCIDYKDNCYKILIHTLLVSNPVPSKYRPDEVLFVIITREDTSALCSRTITVIEFQKFTEMLDPTPIGILNVIVKNIDSICKMLQYPDRLKHAVDRMFNDGEVWIDNKKYKINRNIIENSICYKCENYTITEE